MFSSEKSLKLTIIGRHGTLAGQPINLFQELAVIFRANNGGILSPLIPCVIPNCPISVPRRFFEEEEIEKNLGFRWQEMRKKFLQRLHPR